MWECFLLSFLPGVGLEDDDDGCWGRQVLCCGVVAADKG